jgi:fimbrial chaperone protein
MAAVLVLAICTTRARAGGLRIEPVMLDLNAPAMASFLTLHNGEDREMAVQTRVFRWVQESGKEDLRPVSDVAVSPPIAMIQAGADYTVRVVRTVQRPVSGEESYRLWIDQLPDARWYGQAGLNILIRQSIPVFFRAPGLSAPNLAWSVVRAGGSWQVVAHNTGDEHVRIASLSLTDDRGKTASSGRGLVGYVLGGSTMAFTFARTPPGFAADGVVKVAVESTAGPMQAQARVQDQSQR